MRPGKQAGPAGFTSHHASHVVQFYQDPEFLCRTAADFLAEGLQAGQPALVIAGAGNQAAIADYLVNQEIDVEGLMEQGRYVVMNAQELLAGIMEGSMPDAARFDAAVGGVIANCLSIPDSGPVRVYGEMVDLLWHAGNPRAAVRLEQFWNELGGRHAFSLMCGYRLEGFPGGSETGTFTEICALHTRVLPAQTGVRR